MEDLRRIAHAIASFEDAPTQSGRPTGLARGGRKFEDLVAEQLLHYALLLSTAVPSLSLHRVGVTRDHPSSSSVLDDAFSIQNKAFGRTLVFVLPSLRQKLADFATQNTFPPLGDPIPIPQNMLKRKFPVNEWYNSRLGELREKGWIPGEDEELPYTGDRYPRLYQGKSTEFDGVVVLLERGQLLEKILLELKSLKSSRGRNIDGNAHERFAYQNMDYLEIGGLYPRTSLLLLTNDAILRYRNKYHTGIGVHALRLSYAFCWYKFEMVSSVQQYVRLFTRWKDWLEGR